MSKNISPIDAARALTPHWLLKIREFDALEIHPCAVVGHDSIGGDIVEQCEPEDAHFWTVFGHCRSGGGDDFGDFASEVEATVFHDRLIAIYPHLAGQEVDPMSRLRFIDIDGKRYLWRDIVQMRREQKKAHAVAQQPPLFELKLDCRPASEQTAAGALSRTLAVWRGQQVMTALPAPAQRGTSSKWGFPLRRGCWGCSLCTGRDRMKSGLL